MYADKTLEFLQFNVEAMVKTKRCCCICYTRLTVTDLRGFRFQV